MNAHSTETVEAEIRRLVDGWVTAVRAKDVDGMIQGYSPEVVTFDAVGTLVHKGLAAARRRAAEWTSSFRGPIQYELRDMQVDGGEDTAFMHSLNHVEGVSNAGTKVSMWVRATVCFRKIDGQWQVTHEHVSVPFDPASGKAVTDGQP